MSYDFSGWATKNDIKCSDGRTIRNNAFADQDGTEVPLVWNHQHSSPENTLGHALLENRPGEGVYCYCTLNDTEAGKQTKALVQHGDVKSLSIWANQLVEQAKDVIHGVIREVSVVLAGANGGALIDNVLAHADDADDGVIIQNSEVDGIYIAHGEGDPQPQKKEEKKGKTYQDIIDTMTPEQKNVMQVLVGMALEQSGKASGVAAHSADGELSEEEIDKVLDSMTDEQLAAVSDMVDEASNTSDSDDEDDTNLEDELMQSLDNSDDDDDDDDEDDDDDDDYTQEENEMKHNAFDSNSLTTNGETKAANLAHSAEFIGSVFETAKKYGSLKDSVLAHADKYGIEDIEQLFPDAKNFYNEPEFIKRRTEWVTKVFVAAKKSPFSRIKTMFADITEDEARASGYLKGNRKIPEVFKLLKRITTPYTVVKLQKLDRDDTIDITDFDIVAYIRAEMRVMYEEECSRLILVGDGRDISSPQHVDENCIRPIWKDDDLFSIHKVVPIAANASDDDKAKAFIRLVIKSRKEYKGTGNPTLFTTEDMYADMMLLTDGMGRDLYDSPEKLKAKLRVSDIVTVPIMEGLNRQDGNDTKYLLGILVNMNDYVVGSDKGGKLAFFDDFDLNFNKLEYLMESRWSGALVRPFSAMVYEVTYHLSLTVQPDDPTTTRYGKLISSIQDKVYINDHSIQGELAYISNWTGYDADPVINTGNFLGIKIVPSASAKTYVKTIGGLSDANWIDFGDDDYVVVKVLNNNQKICFKTVINEGETNEEVIEKTYSCSGLKLLKV